jgi:hypothetical protein
MAAKNIVKWGVYKEFEICIIRSEKDCKRGMLFMIPPNKIYTVAQ